MLWCLPKIYSKPEFETTRSDKANKANKANKAKIIESRLAAPSITQSSTPKDQNKSVRVLIKFKVTDDH